MSDLALTDEQMERYSRHILLREVGGEGQKKLLRSSAFVVGAGGLGSAALLYLAAAGVGTIGIADGDNVELSNLQRQIIHKTPDIGRSKVASAAEAVRQINPDCGVVAFCGRLIENNIRQVIRAYDVVLDGSDNFPTRYLVADSCRLEQIPLVSAAAVRFEGQLLTVLPGEDDPCYRCLYPEPPVAGETAACYDAGILGAVAGVMGTLQAVEALKILLGLEGVLSHRILAYDALRPRFVLANRFVNPACASVGHLARDSECGGARTLCCSAGLGV